MRKQKQKWVWLLHGRCCWPDPNPGSLHGHPQAGREGLRTWVGEKLGQVLDDNGLGDHWTARTSPCSPGQTRPHERWLGEEKTPTTCSRTAQSTGHGMQQRMGGWVDGLVDGLMDV